MQVEKTMSGKEFWRQMAGVAGLVCYGLACLVLIIAYKHVSEGPSVFDSDSNIVGEAIGRYVGAFSIPVAMFFLGRWLWSKGKPKTERPTAAEDLKEHR
jgi:hypothetical protein